MARESKKRKLGGKPWVTAQIPEEIREADSLLLRVLFDPKSSLKARLDAARRARLLWERFRPENERRAV